MAPVMSLYKNLGGLTYKVATPALRGLPCEAKETVHVVVSHKQQPLLLSGRTVIRPGGDKYSD